MRSDFPRHRLGTRRLDTLKTGDVLLADNPDFCSFLLLKMEPELNRALWLALEQGEVIWSHVSDGEHYSARFELLEGG